MVGGRATSVWRPVCLRAGVWASNGPSALATTLVVVVASTSVGVGNTGIWLCVDSHNPIRHDVV